ncbi:hypothetical protein ACQKEY_19920 [Lysinibacillus fusiformis]|uniref:hypothetical protein n=1 Tax=Lysinibacillus fusiformis TaxID=28031 RepID=UPI003CFC69C3
MLEINNEKVNILDNLNELSEVLEHIYYYFDKLSQSIDLPLVLETKKNSVTLKNGEKYLQARWGGIDSITFRSHEKLYGSIIWSRKWYVDSLLGGKTGNFTNRVLDRIFEDFIN